MSRRRSIFPGRFQPSIFNADELNFRVRHGNGWILIAINTGYSFSTKTEKKSKEHKEQKEKPSTD